MLICLSGGDIVADQMIDFTVVGSVKNVHQPDDTYATIVEVEIRDFTNGVFPDDIDDIVFEGPGGVLASLSAGELEFEQYDNTSGYYYVILPGSPQLGTYTITVTCGGAVRTSTDTQTVIREIPLPDVSSFSPQPSDRPDSMTPIFSWDPVSYGDTTLYYRWQIKDDQGNYYNTPRTANLTSLAAAVGYLAARAESIIGGCGCPTATTGSRWKTAPRANGRCSPWPIIWIMRRRPWWTWITRV